MSVLLRFRRKQLKPKFALAAILSILIVSALASVYFYTEQQSATLDLGTQKQVNNELQQQITDLQNQITNLTVKANDLQSQNSHLQNQNTYLDTQKSILTNQTTMLRSDNANLKATIEDLQLNLPNRPNLVTRLGTTDVLNNSNSQRTFRPRLYIQGEVFNTGGVTAYNARLHVILYIGDQIIEDTYIELGNIEPLNCVHVNKDIHYDTYGERLTNWTITPEVDTR